MSLSLEIIKSFNDAISIKENIQGSEVTTFALGGNLDLILEPKTIEALSGLVAYLYQNEIKYKILGNGSNLVIPDIGIRVPVIKIGKLLNKCSFLEENDFFSNIDKYKFVLGEKYKFIIFSAAYLMNLSRQFTMYGFSGLEFAAGIPATIGGAVYMNAGAHGGSISDVISKVFVVSNDGSKNIINRDQINYQYRKSNLPEKSVVYAVEIELQFSEKELISQKRAKSLEYRKLTQPLQFPSAGSVFKNLSPEKLALSRIQESKEQVAAAELLEKCGLKGFEFGGVGFSKVHSNWLVKINSNAKAAEAKYLLDHAIEKVEREFGVVLESEIIFW